MQYLLLSAAIVAEVVGTLSLKASAGFTRMSPSLLVAAGYATAFVLLAQVLKLGMPIGTAYAIWASIGIALVAVAGHFIFNETLTARAIIGIGLIIAGVVLVETGRWSPPPH